MSTELLRPGTVRWLTALALAACAALTAPAVASPVRHVRVGDYFFGPSRLRVPRGTKVTWRWDGRTGIPHSVTVTSGPVHFSSRIMTSGSFSHVFGHRGTYHLYCKIHMYDMVETVVVH